MTDQQTDLDDDQQEPDDAPPGAGDDGEQDAERVDDLPPWAQKLVRRTRDEAKRYRTQVRELEPLAQQARDAAEADKTELQRALEAQAAAEAARDDATAQLARTQVALSKGLTAAQAKRLQGSTVEELEADADELLELLAPAAPAPDDRPDARRRPVERLRGGTQPDAPAGDLTPEQISERMRSRSPI